MLRSLISSTISTGLSVTGKVLSAGSKVLESGVALLRPRVEEPPATPRRPTPAAGASTAATIEKVESETAPARVGRVVETSTSTPMLDETPHVRTSESHIAEIAEQPATDVVKLVPTLSTDQLRLLTEHEMSHRNRKTVLKAIEDALVPGGAR